MKDVSLMTNRQKTSYLFEYLTKTVDSIAETRPFEALQLTDALSKVRDICDEHTFWLENAVCPPKSPKDKPRTIKCHFCGQEMEAEEKKTDYHICPPQFPKDNPLGLISNNQHHA